MYIPKACINYVKIQERISWSCVRKYLVQKKYTIKPNYADKKNLKQL